MLNILSSHEILENIIETILILALAWLINKLLQKLIRVPARLETRRAKTLTAVVQSLVSILTFTFALYFIFKMLGIDPTPLIASAGIAGLALGFGARSLVEDLISGIFLLLEDSIAVGDLIRAGKSEGIVKNISFRKITLQDKDGALHIIPNGQVKTVVNLSRAQARINIDLTFSTEQKIDDVLKIANKTLSQIQKDEKFGKRIFSESEVKGIEDFIAGGKMIVKVVLFTSWRNQWETARAFRLALKRNLESAKIPLS